MSSDRQPLLDARDITVRFGGLTAVDAVSARFMPGELVGIIGPNGAGKTTFFNAISGVTQPTSGALTVQGRELAGKGPHRFAANGLARTFQTPRTFADMLVRDNIAFGLKFAGRRLGCCARPRASSA
jgi:branched-chain amino acid transport system ATP-binding protein